MDAGDLKVFEAVARLGGMSRASAELNTVQSNVTQRIRLLEEEIGQPLFARHSRGVSLTAAGRRLIPYASRVMHLLEDARRAARDDGTPQGRLVLGSLETTAAVRLSPILRAYVADHPQVDLVLRTGTTGELIEEVLSNRLEGAFVCGPVNHVDLVAETAFVEDLALVTAAGAGSLDQHLRSDGVRIVVLRASCSYRQRLEEILARRGAVSRRVLEFGTIEAILGCVAAGLGITLLPRSVVEAARREGRVSAHELPPADSRVETLLIRRRDAHLSSALAVFLRYACEALRPAAAAE